MALAVSLFTSCACAYTILPRKAPALALMSSRRSTIAVGASEMADGSQPARDNAYITKLMMVRGGNNEEDATDIESDYDSESDEEVIETKSTAYSPKEIENAKRQASLSQQSRNFGIATALWSSLFFDSILNKAKRLDLFPSVAIGEATSAVVSNLVPTACLASGFAFASGVSFLLWRDFDVRSEMMDDGEGIKKGDWFLSLSSFVDGERDDESDKIASRTRKWLYFHLGLFGLLNLGAHAGYYFSEASPFLGLSAAAINVHNTLAVANALLKEVSLQDLATQVIGWPLRLFNSRDDDAKSRVDAVSFLFQLSSVAFWVRCIPACRTIISLARELLAGTDLSSVVNNSRQLSLNIASLGRLTLAAGVSQVLFSSRVNSISDRIRQHPFFAVLSGISSLTCFGVGGSLMFSSLKSGLDVSTILSKTVPFDGVLLVLMGLISGYNSALGISESLKRLKE